jgi:two-component system, chemotaxis family, CheB/CheR fusion protein
MCMGGAAPAPRQLVVIGSSAGGIDALSTLVSTLSPSFPAPIVVAQHLDPSRFSHLQEILARKSKVPVRTVQDREPLQDGVVYVVPADRHVEISDHLVSVHAEPRRGRPAPSIDLLLASAAEAFGEQLVAVILTGLGSDGADGARRVKELGGTVVIQNPKTASHPEMPLSLAPTTVDIVAELEAIGPLLKELLTGTYMRVEPDDDRRIRALLEQVRARSGIDFSSYREPTIRRRLQRRVMDTNSATLEDYVRYVRRHPEEYDRLASTFLIKVTDFFRDADLYNCLREQVLPGLIDEARRRGNELRLWSAGCATGEEAYSLAILVSELLAGELDQFAVRVFATDLDADAVAFARRGVYPSSALKDVPSDLRDRYFTPLDSAWEIRKQLRGMVIFGQHDLGQRAPFPRIDLVQCRNVLIYFTPELQRRSLQLFAFALREGGYLVLGKAETTSPLPEHFTLVNPRLKVFRRHGERVLIPPSRMHAATPIPNLASVPMSRPMLGGMERDRTRAHARQMGVPSAAERAEEVLLDLPIGVVVVDRNHDMQIINAAARRLLGIHGSALGEDVIHLAQRVLREPLRDALDGAVSGDPRQSVHEISTLPDVPGTPRFVELSSFVARAHAERPGAPDMIVVLIVDVTERERLLRQQQAALADADARVKRTQELLDESTRSVRELLAANQDLSRANVGLRSANEELLVSSEEAQAAMEEIETLNEEQQATNEELETLNEELQATVEELNATNEDLQSRTLELQERAAAQEPLVASLREERQRLETILASMSDAVMVVDPDGEPVLTNAAFKEVFGRALPTLEDASGHPLPSRIHPARMAARGETFMQPFTVQCEDGSRRWFEASGQPIRMNGMSGGVVVIRDVTDRSLRQLQEQFVALAGHELRTPLAALHGSLQLLQRAARQGATDRAGRYVDIALAQVRLLGDLVQDLTDVIRVQAGQLPIARERVDLTQLVEEAVELARPMGDGREIRIAAPAERLAVSGDPRRLQQVLLNLIANAMQHGSSPRGIDVRLRREDHFAVLEVIDYGRGIPPEHREKVFERFYQADQGTNRGLGVGLYLVQAIVSAHDGTVKVHSAERQGTTFVVRLPVAE